jgi:hypothetical protein
MDAATLTRKHLQERIDLEALQQTQLEDMIKRHKLEALEAKGKYFEEKRQEQLQKLQDFHKDELADLFVMHNKEWEDLMKVKTIIRESQQLSFDLQPKKEPRIQLQPEPEKETLTNRIKKFLERRKTKSKDREQEM